LDIKRFMTNVCSQDLAKSRDFYTALFAFNVDYDSDWFVHLISDGRELEVGIILETHEVVPTRAKGNISGAYLTFVVEDVDAFYNKAKNLNISVLQPPEMTPYGQKRLLLQAPEGTVCDVSSPSTA